MIEVALVLRREQVDKRENDSYSLISANQTWGEAGEVVGVLKADGDGGQFMIVGGSVPDGTRWHEVTEVDIETDRQVAEYMEKHGQPYNRIYPE